MPIYSQVTGATILEHLKKTAANAVAAQEASKKAAADLHAKIQAEKETNAGKATAGA